MAVREHALRVLVTLDPAAAERVARCYQSGRPTHCVVQPANGEYLPAEPPNGIEPLTFSLPSSCTKVYVGRWGRSAVYAGLLKSMRGHAVAAVCCCTSWPLVVVLGGL